MYKNDPMKAYMQDIGEIPLITKEEEIMLAAKIKKGDEPAKHKLIKANLRLVVKIAHDFKGFGLPLLDLISEGNIGLMRAAEKFDPAKGAKFSSYSAWWIKQSMRRALSQKSRTIRVPVASAGKINKIRNAKLELQETLGRQATDTEIAEHLDFTKRTVQGLKLADLKTFSIHDPIQKGEEGNFEEIIPDPNTSTPDVIIEDNESLQRLKGLITRLDERERTILVMRYGLDGSRPKTLEEVSKIIGRTRERVRQIQMQSLKKLKSMIDDENLERSEAMKQAAEKEARLSGRKNIKAAIRIAAVEPNALGFKKEELLKCDSPIEDLQLSTRSINSLRSVGIDKISELVTCTQMELLKIRYFGEKCLVEVRDAIDTYHLRIVSIAS
ncbi:MAG: sigma-70 family RNA polymerase sigma factor [Lentisphaeria bacterium]|nr:sigma-70 family RNA polymerase sigma factor [Lentisphaeria bacterium]NQZ70944.1 sigma-70 family RNA polymerase sigma factor [Lentisphaeria bacterium]